MTPNDSEIIEILDCDVIGFISKLCIRMNKSGVLTHKNNKPIRSYAELIKELNITKKVWDRYKRNMDKFNVLKKVKYRNKSILVINPRFHGKCYEVTEVKFIFFAEFYKKHLEEIEYIYLCKKYDIVPIWNAI